MVDNNNSAAIIAAAMHTAVNAVQALGRGFDVNFDTRLLYCKGGSVSNRIVPIDDQVCRNLFLYDNIIVPNVSRDITTYHDSVGRLSSGICNFHEMAKYFNEKAGLSGDLPLGSFNSAFNFNGSKHIDAESTKTLSMDGYYIPLAKVQLRNSTLVLQENLRRSIPNFWDPPALSSFIETYGTHVITSVTIGGKDVIYVKQHQSSPLSTMEIKSYIQDIGNQRFSDNESHTSSSQSRSKDKGPDSGLFNSQGIYPQPYLTGKEDVTVIFRRRGGDDLEQNHMQWIKTVLSSPDVIDMTFIPITSLLDDGIAGKEYLIRAINLYLEYKPPIEEVRYFLEFQIPRVWAPLENHIPGQQRKEPICPSLQFSMMGQKLYVCQEQVSVGRRPVTGFRLCLEGAKQNRLSIHLQHLSSLPKSLRPYWDSHIRIGAPRWQGPEEQDSRWFEPVKWKNFSHVSTAPIENPETFIADLSGVYIVTGAQLGVWDFGSRNVLYMKLLYSRVPGCTIRRSLWDHVPIEKSNKDTASTSGDKLAKFVDMSEMFKGPEDLPGHWLVTGGKLGVEKHKIVLRVKYSLLNY
ncbi:hypothetical protein ACFE04_000846 [Oxalis oulophora]